MSDDVFQLVIRRGPMAGQIFTLDLNRIVLGRDPFSDIVFDDPEVSRHHASLWRGSSGYALQDLGSTNGTFVEGQRLGVDPVALVSGQRIGLGTNVLFVYRKAPASDPLATMISDASDLGQIGDQTETLRHQAEEEGGPGRPNQAGSTTIQADKPLRLDEEEETG